MAAAKKKAKKAPAKKRASKKARPAKAAKPKAAEKKRMMQPEDIDLVPQGVCARALGITTRTLINLRDKEIISPVEEGGSKYNLQTAAMQYYRYRYGVDEKGEEAARVKLIKQQELKLRMANDKEAGLLVSAADVSAAFVEYSTALRAGNLALAPRLASRLSNVSQPSRIKRIIKDEVNLFLRAAEELFTTAVD